MIHGHGDDIYNQDTEVISNFSSNVFEQWNLDWLQEFLKDKLSIFTSYPEPNATSFVQVLAKKNFVSEDTICATRGATGAIYLIAQVFSHSNTAIFAPTFSEYEDACQINRHRLTFIKDQNDINRKNFELVWLCNPNNPTGKTWDYDSLLSMIDENPKTIFVIDQTYHYFTLKPTLSYYDAVQRNNVIIIDSFTKRFALPDLRLGYFVTNPQLVEKIQYYKQPWTVSQLAIEIGKYILKNTPYPLDINLLLEETQYLQGELNKIKNIEVKSTDTHFFLCEMRKGTAASLKSYLLKECGVLIRNADNFEGLNAAYFRIATQGREDNDRLIEGVRQYMGNI